MLNEGQNARIESLYKVYQTDIKPLTFYVERKYHKFPQSLLKEFRDVFDHISRSYEDDAEQEYIDSNIKKAENHFDRISLDTYKYVSDYKKRKFSSWKRKYSKYNLQSINDGEFWLKILELEEDGERIFAEARKVEAKDINKACSLIQDSTLKYAQIEKLIEEKREYVVKAKFRYIRGNIKNLVIGFLLGIVASVLATGIWEYIISPFLP